MGRILGIDHGSKRIGLALSDAGATLARPLAVVAGEEALWPELERLLGEEEIERVVIGLPRNMDGTLGPKAREVLAFKERLEARTGLPVETWDERLTSREAERALRARGLSSRQMRGKVDKLAAQILLQSYLDARARRGREEAEPRAGGGGLEGP
jgi:putative Holliday junction resolvase